MLLSQGREVNLNSDTTGFVEKSQFSGPMPRLIL